MSVQKYAEDKDVMAALSKWRGCQRFFKQRGEKVSFEEIVVNSNKDGQEAVRRKLRVESLGDDREKRSWTWPLRCLKTEIMASTIITATVILVDENEDEESVKRGKQSPKLFYCA